MAKATTARTGGAPVDSDDIRQIIEDALDPINVKMDTMQSSINKIDNTAISRIEYDPAIRLLRKELKNLRKSLRGMRTRQEDQWKNLLYIIGAVGSAIFVYVQIAGHLSFR
jgi:uncharacterized protein YpuA (DUF1002 family)